MTFTLNAGAWTTDTDIDMTLVNSGSTWTLTDHGDTVETYKAVSATEALLQTIQARNGYTQTLLYNSNNQVTSVTDSFNRQLSFTYSNSLLQSVTTPDGLVVTYGLTSSGTSNLLTSVSYSTTPPTTKKYVYENSALPAALTGIVDENGSRYMTWTYDSSGRALTSQSGAGADLTTIAYNDGDGSRTVTNPLGEQVLYKFSTLQGVPKVVEADRIAGTSISAATSTFTYDSNGYMASETDWNGNKTAFINDLRGEPIVINEAVGTPLAKHRHYLSPHLPASRKDHDAGTDRQFHLRYCGRAPHHDEYRYHHHDRSLRDWRANQNLDDDLGQFPSRINPGSTHGRGAVDQIHLRFKRRTDIDHECFEPESADHPALARGASANGGRRERSDHHIHLRCAPASAFDGPANVGRHAHEHIRV